MGEKKVAELLQKYLNGKASQEETDRVLKWYGSIQTNKKLSDEELRIISQKMSVNIKNAMNEKSRKRNLHHPLLKVAALVFILLSVGLFFLEKKSADSISEPLRIVSTKAKERKEVNLSDGSKLILAPLSTITFPRKFTVKSRKVTLVAGEAFFSIAHEQKRSFIVESGSGLEVAVLGTSFTVHNFKKEDFLKVTVSTGKVAVRNGGNLIATLIKGQELRFNKSSLQYSIGYLLNPTIEEISFDGSSLLQVIQKLQYVYSIHIRLDNSSLSSLKSTANFNSAQQPAEILDILCRLHHLRFSSSKDHQTFKIYK